MDIVWSKQKSGYALAVSVKQLPQILIAGLHKLLCNLVYPFLTEMDKSGPSLVIFQIVINHLYHSPQLRLFGHISLLNNYEIVFDTKKFDQIGLRKLNQIFKKNVVRRVCVCVCILFQGLI